jgi:hypothetical protein
MVQLPVCEISLIAPPCHRLRRLLHLGFPPWRSRASPQAARLLLDAVVCWCGDVPCRRVIGNFPWLGAVVAA